MLTTTPVGATLTISPPGIVTAEAPTVSVCDPITIPDPLAEIIIELERVATAEGVGLLVKITAGTVGVDSSVLDVVTGRSVELSSLESSGVAVATAFSSETDSMAVESEAVLAAVKVSDATGVVGSAVVAVVAGVAETTGATVDAGAAAFEELVDVFKSACGVADGVSSLVVVSGTLPQSSPLQAEIGTGGSQIPAFPV